MKAVDRLVIENACGWQHSCLPNSDSKRLRIPVVVVLVEAHRFCATLSMAAASEKGCCVCDEQAPKYRCPGCRLRYCSVLCCKKHKEECIPKSKPVPEPALPEISSTFRDYTPSEKEENGVYTEDILGEDDESDKVPLEKLKLLGESKEMKDLLQNPHLAQLLVAIDTSEEKASAMKKYMQEPLLVEFADCCLRIVQPPENTNLRTLEEVKLQDLQELMLQ